MKKILLLFAVVTCLIAGTSGAALALPSSASLIPAKVLAVSPTDAAKSEVCNGLNSQISPTGELSKDSGCQNKAAETDIYDAIRAVLEILSWIAGIAAVIMIIVAGLKYVTSGGDSSSIASAKTSLIYALIGIIVVALAQTIVRFVLGRAT
jgi:hypothetical protein